MLKWQFLMSKAIDPEPLNFSASQAPPNILKYVVQQFAKAGRIRPDVNANSVNRVPGYKGYTHLVQLFNPNCVCIIMIYNV